MKDKKIIIFEGIDGSGKSTLINQTSNLLADNQISHSIISREITPASTLISNGFVGLDLPPSSEICLRIAREFINETLIRNQDKNVFLIDRSLLTISAILKVHGLEENSFSTLLKELYKEFSSIGLIFCNLPFESAKNRVYQRLIKEQQNNLKSIQELESHECDYQMYLALNYHFNQSSFFSKKLEIDTSVLNIQDSAQKIMNFISDL